MHHVIIGAGPAGVIAAETLHKLDPGAKITLVGDEPEPPYSRMAIPYYLIDRIGEDGTYLRKTEGYYEGCATTVVQDRIDTKALMQLCAAHERYLAGKQEKDDGEEQTV